MADRNIPYLAIIVFMCFIAGCTVLNKDDSSLIVDYALFEKSKLEEKSQSHLGGTLPLSPDDGFVFLVRVARMPSKSSHAYVQYAYQNMYLVPDKPLSFDRSFNFDRKNVMFQDDKINKHFSLHEFDVAIQLDFDKTSDPAIILANVSGYARELPSELGDFQPWFETLPLKFEILRSNTIDIEEIE